jgi:hypothetical protein
LVVTGKKLFKSAGVKVTESVWPRLAFNTVPVTGE